MSVRWRVYRSPTQLVEGLVESIAANAARAVAERGSFHIVLSGGSTPRTLYAALADRDLAWTKWHVYFTDERCLPIGDRDRNDVMARSTLLDQVPIPQSQIHAIPAELGPQPGAEAYRATLAGVGDFDLALLGLGEDGHTASLFPGHPSGDQPDTPDVLAVQAAPKPPPARVSLSASRLARSRAVLVIVTGAAKRPAVRQLYERANIPILSAAPPGGLDVALDAAAAVPELVD